ncbi:MAG: HAD family hydrolase [Acidobacteria bacterium]|nr:HAD family hydrolase [Acidobacteriota bacterium]
MHATNLPQSWLCDMDGVLVSDGRMVAGADRFLARLREANRSFLVLTNNSFLTPEGLSERLSAMGLDVAPGELWTSAMATARFVQSQHPNGTAFVIGEAGVHEALRAVGYTESDQSPQYVVLGETQDYSFDEFATAIGLIERGSRFVATNPEPTGPGATGSLPGCGAMARLIESATGVKPYFVGKPNPIMIREALRILDGHSKSAVMVGDRMETDILAGVEAGLTTILVLSGVTQENETRHLPYRPTRIVDSIADLIDEI